MAKKMATKSGSKSKPMTKTAVFQELAARTNLSRKQVTEVFDALLELIKKELTKKGGVFTIPTGLVKVKRVEKAATKERMGRNPATGEPMVIAAKPKRTVIKALALKTLKELAQS
jgi:nucleoid DNA-binding protein